jgi:hypothetical protein
MPIDAKLGMSMRQPRRPSLSAVYSRWDKKIAKPEKTHMESPVELWKIPADHRGGNCGINQPQEKQCDFSAKLGINRIKQRSTL